MRVCIGKGSQKRKAEDASESSKLKKPATTEEVTGNIKDSTSEDSAKNDGDAKKDDSSKNDTAAKTDSKNGSKADPKSEDKVDPKKEKPKTTSSGKDVCSLILFFKFCFCITVNVHFSSFQLPKSLPLLEKYWKAVKDDPNDFTGWTYLLQYVDQAVS